MRNAYESISSISLLLKMKSYDDATFPWYHGENHAKTNVDQAKAHYSVILFRLTP